MKTTRRNLLALGGGTVAGLAFTPVPWKLLDDTSIWSQNWPWIPQPAHAAVETKSAACGLCPHGCGLRVRMAAGFPVGISGNASHPVTGGALCPLAFGAHQLNWHPRRLRTPLHRGRPATWEEASAAFAKASAEGKVAVIDGRPGRAASGILREFAKQHGSYSVVHTAEQRAMAPYAAWSGAPAESLGYDLEKVRTVVSFGAPLLESWGAPGRFARLWSEKAAGSGDPELRIIQIETALSHTASCSWRWVPIHSGSDAALAAGIARVLLEERLIAAEGPMPSKTVDDAASETALPAGVIVELARAIASWMPAVAIASGEQPAVAALNVLLGGEPVQRKESLAADPMPGSARAALIDATAPWSFEAPAGAEVFRFSAWDGGETQTDWLLPAAGFLEEMTEHPTAPVSPVATYALSPALMTPPHRVSSAAEFVGGAVEDAITARCALIGKKKDELLAGAVWVDDAATSRRVRCELREWPAATEIAPHLAWTGSWTAPVLPPLAAKLYQESNLRSRS